MHTTAQGLVVPASLQTVPLGGKDWTGALDLQEELAEAVWGYV